MSACGLFPGARLELRLTQGQSHRSPLGREAGAQEMLGKWVRACSVFGFPKTEPCRRKKWLEPMLLGSFEKGNPIWAKSEENSVKYKCSSCTSRVSGFQHQWDGDQTAFPWKAVIVFVIPCLLSFQPELFNIPWHLCITSVSTSLCVMALAGGSSVCDVSL